MPGKYTGLRDFESLRLSMNLNSCTVQTAQLNHLIKQNKTDIKNFKMLSHFSHSAPVGFRGQLSERAIDENTDGERFVLNPRYISQV